MAQLWFFEMINGSYILQLTFSSVCSIACQTCESACNITCIFEHSCLYIKMAVVLNFI